MFNIVNFFSSLFYKFYMQKKTVIQFLYTFLISYFFIVNVIDSKMFLFK